MEWGLNHEPRASEEELYPPLYHAPPGPDGNGASILAKKACFARTNPGVLPDSCLPTLSALTLKPDPRGPVLDPLPNHPIIN